MAQATINRGDSNATRAILSSIAGEISLAKEQNLNTHDACLERVQGEIAISEQAWSRAAKHLLKAAHQYGLSMAYAEQIGTLNELARVYLDTAREAEAQTVLDQVGTLLTKVQVQQTIGVERRSIANSHRGWVDLQVRLRYQTHSDQQANAAFLASSQHRGELLRNVTDAHTLTTSHQAQQHRLADLLIRKSVLLNSAQQGPQLRDVMLELAEIETNSTSESAYHQNTDSDHTLADISHRLPEHTALLHYHLGRKESYVWVLTNELVSVHPISPRTKIQAAANKLRSALSESGHARDGYSHAANLANLILAPIAPEIKDKNLLIVPDGSLVQIPFAILPVEHDGLRPQMLGSRANITYLPWPGIPRSTRLADARQIHAALVTIASNRTTALPGIHQEATAMKQLVASNLETHSLQLRDGSAVQAFLEEPRNILHFSAHAFAHLTEPAVSAITAFEDPYQSLAEGESLTAIEISKMTLNNHLVVLNACETGVVTDAIGNEANSLSGAFLQAGSEHVISSLWRVPSLAAARFSQEFYAALAANSNSISRALTVAQQKMRKSRQWRSPHFWSGFILTSLPRK